MSEPPKQAGKTMLGEFTGGMRQLGWVEGIQVAYEVRDAGGVDDRFAALVRELIASRVSVIVAVSGGAAHFAKLATTTIPVVFVAPDPVEAGLVKSLSQPGGNLTGLAFLASEIIGKRMQLLKEVAPSIGRVGYLGYEDQYPTAVARAAAKALQLEIVVSGPDRPEDLPLAISAVPMADAWFVEDYAMFYPIQQKLVELIAAQRKPAIYPDSSFVHAGGLMSYGTDFWDLARRAATYVDKILRGAKPSDLPVEQPTRFSLVLNMRAATTLKLTIAQSLLLRADEVIQ